MNEYITIEELIYNTWSNEEVEKEEIPFEDADFYEWDY